MILTVACQYFQKLFKYVIIEGSNISLKL